MDIQKLVSNAKIFDTFINLYFRWQDEGQYEDFNDYANVMRSCVERNMGITIDMDSFKGTKRPFGITFAQDGKTINLFIRSKGQGRYCLAASETAIPFQR